MQERKRTRQDTFEPHKSEYDAERKRTKRKKKSRQREREARQKDALPVAVGGSSEETWETRTTTSLDNLPVEIIHEIHLYAKNPALAILNRRFRAIFATCSSRYRARYLISCWHEDYCYGFEPFPVRDLAPPPHIPKAQTDKRPRPELTWQSRFLPVLPTAEFPHPLARSFQRSADHLVLDYCLRYPMCDLRVLDAAEDLLRHRDEFGNIRLTTGLWRRRQDGRLYSFDQLASIETRDATERTKKAREDTLSTGDEVRDSGDDKPLIWTIPEHLSCSELPKRLFQGLSSSVMQPTKNKEARNESEETEAERLDPLLIKHLSIFGPGPYPPPSKLLLLLSLFTQHVSTTAESNLSTLQLVNSFEGLPLVKAVFAQSLFLTNFLLALGAEPSRKGNLALYVAIRAGWIEGLQSMVERDEAKIEAWKTALDAIHLWFYKEEYNARFAANFASESNGSSNLEAPSDTQAAPSSGMTPDAGATSTASKATNNNNKKRRRLLDRARLEEKMIFEAVRYEKWDVANWIQAKGIVPDLVTIRLVEAKLADGKGPPSSSSASTSAASASSSSSSVPRPRNPSLSTPPSVVSHSRQRNEDTKPQRPRPPQKRLSSSTAFS